MHIAKADTLQTNFSWSENCFNMLSARSDMLKVNIKLLNVVVAALSMAAASQAFATTFKLNNSTATVVSGNISSSFYKDERVGNVETGTAAALYSTTFGGSAPSPGTGWYAMISFGSNPQPVLTGASIKAGNYYLSWDASDLSAFNSGKYDSITIYQDGIRNNPGNSFLNISHVNLDGKAGTAVPDGGSTVFFLGVGLMSVGLLNRGLKTLSRA